MLIKRMLQKNIANNKKKKWNYPNKIYIIFNYFYLFYLYYCKSIN